MATQTVAIRAGGSAATSRARSAVLSVGVGLGIGTLPWNTSTAKRSANKWLPRTDIPWFDPRTGRPTPIFAAFMVELAENRLGGTQGQSVTQISTTVTQTQAQVVETTNYASQAVQFTRGVAASVDAVTQVAKTNNLSGADTIPPTPPPPSAPSAGTGRVLQ